jgi:chemotaxis protein MotB
MERSTISREYTWIILSVLFIVFIAGGCVSSSKYKALESQHMMLQEENRELNARTISLNEQITQVRDQNAQLAQQKRDQERLMNQMIEDLKTEVSNKSVQIEMMEESLQLKAIEKLFFESGSAVVSRPGRSILARIAPTLKEANEKEIRIVGHADQIPIGEKLAEKYPSNWELSTARATAIAQILQWGYGIDPKRIVTEGVAHYRPLVMETEKNRATNRVVEIILTSMSRPEPMTP